MIEKNRHLIGALFIILAILVWLLPLPIENDAKIVLSVLVLAILFWVSEIIPLWVTSLLITALLVLFHVFSLKMAIEKFADPILALFFVGFLIARVMQKQGLDKLVALSVLSHISKASLAILALMFITAFLSMWISNTATTIIMLPIALSIVLKTGKQFDNFAKAAVLGIAYAANIGGVGTIIGSPPNAIAVSNLSELASIEVTFLDWMISALPLVLILIPVAWFYLIKFYPLKVENIAHIKSTQKALTEKDKLFISIFVLTVAFWLAKPLHGYSDSLIALLSACVLLIVGLVNKNDLRSISWETIILFGGGLVLGAAMFSTGLSTFFADVLQGIMIGLPEILMILILVVFSIVLGAFASNTATASILVPVVLPIAPAIGLSAKMLGLLVGIAVSFDFLLPVGTPPNALAYATGKVTIREMLKAGLGITFISIIVLTIYSFLFW